MGDIPLGRIGKLDVEVRVQGYVEHDVVEGDGPEAPGRVTVAGRVPGGGGRWRGGVTYEHGSDPIAQLTQWCELDFHQQIELSNEPREQNSGGAQFTYSIRFMTMHFEAFNLEFRINLLRNPRGAFALEAPSLQMTAQKAIPVGDATLRPRFDFTFKPNWTYWGQQISRAVDGVVEAGGRMFRRGATHGAEDVAARLGGQQAATHGAEEGAARLGGQQAATHGAEEGAARLGGQQAAAHGAEEGAARLGGDAAEEAGTRLGQELAERGGERALAREAAAEGGELAARAGMRGTLGTVGHVAGALAEPIMVLVDFYVCLEYVSGIIPEIERAQILDTKVNDFADIVASWVYGGRNQHEARLAIIEQREQGPQSRNGEADYLNRWRQALRAARQEAHAAFQDLRGRDQVSALRQQYTTQEALYHALGEQAARRQGVSFSPDDVRRLSDGSVHQLDRTQVPRNARSARNEQEARRRQADRGARDDDPVLLDHITIHDGQVVVDDRPFWLGSGIEVKMLSARQEGYAPDGRERWRCGLEITNAMPGSDTVESGEGPIENRVGHTFHLTAIGNPNQ